MKLLLKYEVQEGDTSNTVLELETLEDPDHTLGYFGSLNEYGNACAKDYYGCTSTEGKWHYTDDGCIAVSLYSIVEVSDEEYEVLKKYKKTK